MTSDLPEVTRTYQNHHLDSTRWEVYEPRTGDVIVTTAYKSGTTWTQQILDELFHGMQDPRPAFDSVTPWPDRRFAPESIEELRQNLESIEGRRFIKSHLPLDGLPYYPQVQYLIIGRDARDVFMSFFNHYSSYSDLAMRLMNSPDIVGDSLEPCPEDPRELWKSWITRGWFEWETEGYPFWANLGHTASYWSYRHLPNFLFVHYNDMLADLEAAVLRIAQFLGEDPTPEHLAQIVENTTFSNVRAKAIANEEEGMRDTIFKGGVETFFFKGMNGRWRDVLNESDLALYEKAKQRVLTPECARWLEEGGDIS